MKTCALCGTVPEKLFRCGKCKEATYCCKEHQVSAWPVHKKTCGKRKGKKAWQVVFYQTETLEDSNDHQGIIEMATQIKSAATEAASTDVLNAGRMLLRLGYAYTMIGNYTEAKQIITTTLDLAEERGQPKLTILTLNHLLVLTLRQEYYSGSIILCKEGHRIATELGEMDICATFLLNWAQALTGLGEFVKAIDKCNDAMSIWVKLENGYRQCLASQTLCEIYMMTNDLENALTEGNKVLEASTRNNDEELIADANGLLANVYSIKNDSEKAIVCYSRAIDYAVRVNDYHRMFGLHHNIAQVYVRSKQYDKALEFHDRNLKISRATDNEADFEHTCLWRGVTYWCLFMSLTTDEKRQHLLKNDLRDDDNYLKLAQQNLLMGGDCLVSSMYLAYLNGFACADDHATAIDYLKKFLDRKLEKSKLECTGCLQKRGEDAKLLTCSGCKVAKFCSVDHQALASKRNHPNTSHMPPHKDLCPLLRHWKLVKAGKMQEDECKSMFIDFLQKQYSYRVPKEDSECV